MPTYTLRPNQDVVSTWTLSSGATSYSLLDDNVTNLDTPTTGSDCITCSTNGLTHILGFEDIAFAANEQVESVELNVYGKASGTSKYTLVLGAASPVDITSTSFAWSTTAAFSSPILNQSDLNNLTLTITSTGTDTLEIDTIYITVTTAFLDTNPTLVSEGSVSATAAKADISPTIPAHVTDDILIAIVQAWFPDTASDIDDIPTPTGWTQIGSQISTLSPADGKIGFFYKRATDSATTVTFTTGSNWSTTGSSSSYSAIVDVYRGCITSGNPYGIVNTMGPYTSGTSNFGPAVNVYGPKRLGLIYGIQHDNTTTVLGGTNLTGATPPWTLNAARNNATGTDSGFRLAYRNCEANFSSVTVTNSAIVQGGVSYRALALKPPYLPLASGSYINLPLLCVG